MEVKMAEMEVIAIVEVMEVMGVKMEVNGSSRSFRGSIEVFQLSWKRKLPGSFHRRTFHELP